MMVLGTNMCVNVRTLVKHTFESCGEEAAEFCFVALQCSVRNFILFKVISQL